MAAYHAIEIALLVLLVVLQAFPGVPGKVRLWVESLIFYTTSLTQQGDPMPDIWDQQPEKDPIDALPEEPVVPQVERGDGPFRIQFADNLKWGKQPHRKVEGSLHSIKAVVQAAQACVDRGHEGAVYDAQGNMLYRFWKGLDGELTTGQSR